MLTAKQETFALKIVEGMNQADAYRAAYNTSRMSDKQIWEEASKLASSPKVSQRITELRESVATKSILTAQERLEWLTGLIRDNEVSIADKLKASDQMNRMQGEYVQKIDADVKQEFCINVELIDDEG